MRCQKKQDKSADQQIVYKENLCVPPEIFEQCAELADFEWKVSKGEWWVLYESALYPLPAESMNAFLDKVVQTIGNPYDGFQTQLDTTQLFQDVESEVSGFMEVSEVWDLPDGYITTTRIATLKNFEEVDAGGEPEYAGWIHFNYFDKAKWTELNNSGRAY